MFRGHSRNSKLCFWTTTAFSWPLRKFKETLIEYVKEKVHLHVMKWKFVRLVHGTI